MLVSILLWNWLFSDVEFWKLLVLVGTPLLIVSIGFRIITYYRISTFREQLYNILSTLEEFDVDEPEKVKFDKSLFPIFNELNEYLVELIDRVRTNYQANKQFTQNASHELQTPLAVIKGHVEILLQSSRLGEKEIESLAAVLQNTNRLSKLNSTLILLSKIENQRFSDTQFIDIQKVVEEVLHNFKDLIQIQNIEIRNKNIGTFQVEMSETLAEILIANLIQNGIRYNIPDGYIEIEIKENELIITNPGKPLAIKPKLMFNRFRRDSTVEESLGLGLSIVKRICDSSGLEVQYQNEGVMHILVIKKS